MSGLDIIGDPRGARGARAIAIAVRAPLGVRAPARRLDDVWGPVGRRSGVVVAGFVLLLLSLGLLLLDVAMEQYPRAPRGPDRVLSQSGAVIPVAGQYAGVRFALNQR